MGQIVDKQNLRFVRNLRTASSLANESELNEVYGVRVRHALTRAKKAAFTTKFKSEKINYNLTKTLTNALLDVSASKLTKREVEIIRHFDELMHMDLKQAKASKLVPTKADVVILFKMLKKSNPLRARQLSETFKFRKIV